MRDSIKLGIVLEFLLRGGTTDGAHHKQWAIDQAVRVITCGAYKTWVEEVEAAAGGPELFVWDTGTAP